MQRGLSIVPLTLAASLSAYASGPQKFLHFAIQLPDGYTIVDKSPSMMDFDLYEIRKHDKTLVARLYVGNHPDTKLRTPGPQPSKVAVAMAESSTNSKDYELLLTYSGLEYKGSSGSPWTSIHLFGLTTDIKIRKQIISSVKSITVVRPHIQ